MKMEACSVPAEDLNYLAQQSTGKLNMILAGMTALLSDTDNKVAMMENQTWFQRMCRTISGKNKMTRQEIQKNHDKIIMYMTRAMTELFKQQCLDHQIIMSLGNQLNELYAEHLQLKQMLGAFVAKLNEKIESIDNFHILNAEIGQGVYSDCAPIVAICKILPSMDKRCMLDYRKMSLLQRSMTSQRILNDEQTTLYDYLMSITNIPVEEIGPIYIELGSLRGNFMASIILRLIESYHFLPDMARKLKNKKTVVDAVIADEQLDSAVMLSVNDVFNDLVDSKLDMFDNLDAVSECQAESDENELRGVTGDSVETSNPQDNQVYIPLPVDITDKVAVIDGRYRKVTNTCNRIIETDNYIVSETKSRIICIDKRSALEKSDFIDEEWYLSEAWHGDSVLLKNYNDYEMIRVVDLATNKYMDLHLPGREGNDVYLSDCHVVYRNRDFELQAFSIETRTSWTVSTCQAEDALIKGPKLYFLEKQENGTSLVEHDLITRISRTLSRCQFGYTFSRVYSSDANLYVISVEGLATKRIARIYEWKMGAYDEKIQETACYAVSPFPSFHLSRDGKLVYVDNADGVHMYNFVCGDDKLLVDSIDNEYSVLVVGSFVYYEKNEQVYRVSLNTPGSVASVG